MDIAVPDDEMRRCIADVDAIAVSMAGYVPVLDEPGVVCSSVSTGDAVGRNESAITVNSDGQSGCVVCQNIIGHSGFHGRRGHDTGPELVYDL